MAEAYRISETEVTNSQYAEFLNAVAATDTNALYNTSMGSGFGGIARSGSSGSFSYSAIAGQRGDAGELPVVLRVRLRFANWLHNGQPDGRAGQTRLRKMGLTRSRPTGDREQLQMTRNAAATQVFVHERGRVVQGGLLQWRHHELLRVPGRDGHAERLCSPRRDRQHGELRLRRGRPFRATQSHLRGRSPPESRRMHALYQENLRLRELLTLVAQDPSGWPHRSPRGGCCCGRRCASGGICTAEGPFPRSGTWATQGDAGAEPLITIAC